MFLKASFNGLWFSIEIEEDEFIAFISADALHIHFDALEKTSKALAHAYQRNRHIINETARRKFLRGAMRPITLSVGDF